MVTNKPNDFWGKTFGINTDIVSRKIAGELFLIPVKGKIADLQSIYTLNAVAEYIWKELDGIKSLDEIRTGIVSRFDVKKEQADSDIKEFIDELIKADLIIERD